MNGADPLNNSYYGATANAWETQADGLDHLVCVPINGTTPHTPTLNGTSLEPDPLYRV